MCRFFLWISFFETNHIGNCFCPNSWLLYDDSEMREQLQWLHDTLLEAEKYNERVHILAHVPPNTASCSRSWNREYERIVERFSHIISGQFNGHTHLDEFVLHYINNTNKAISVSWNGGGGTPFVGLNPNYRVYLVESDTFEVIDHETWIFKLNQANEIPLDEITPFLEYSNILQLVLIEDSSPQWFREYTFRESFNITDVSPATLNRLIADDWKRNSSEIVPVIIDTKCYQVNW